MGGTPLDAATIAVVALGALLAGFTTGFAGFGTGLVASGLWFHAMPAAMVPPLVALASVPAQLVAQVSVRTAFEWRRTAPYLIGGALGVPAGVAALQAASPSLLRTMIGAFLVAYAAWQLLQRRGRGIGDRGGRAADAAVGLGGGFLGGFSGLSGPLPLIWLQLRGGDTATQRATYQPFNLVVLTLACAAMTVGGQMTADVLRVAAYSLPATLVGAWLGVRAYGRVSPHTFRRVVLALLLASGMILLGQAVA
jgi:uncharacterized membrane protein YfcA